MGWSFERYRLLSKEIPNAKGTKTNSRRADGVFGVRANAEWLSILIAPRRDLCCSLKIGVYVKVYRVIWGPGKAELKGSKNLLSFPSKAFEPADTKSDPAQDSRNPSI
jgi:hypothetical protein